MGDLSASFRRTFPARLWLEYPQGVSPWVHAIEACAIVGMPGIVIGMLFARSRLRHHWYRSTGIFLWRTMSLEDKRSLFLSKVTSSFINLKKIVVSQYINKR